MVKASLLILSVVLIGTVCAADTPVCITLADLQKFNKGVIDALETNPSSPGACYQGLTKFNADADKAIADIQKLLAGDLSVLSSFTADFQAAITQLKTLETPCKFSTLVADIQALAGSDGQSIIISRYLKHSAAINADLAVIQNCSADSYKCGKAVGDVIKNLVTFTITEDLTLA
jgi:hypothetical protein